MKKENKIIMTCYLVASICFYISSIFCFIGEDDNSKGVVFLCFGSTFLCLSSLYINKDKKDKGKSN